MQTTSIAITSYTGTLRQKDHEIVHIAEYEPVSRSTCTPVHLIFVSQFSSFSFCVCMLFFRSWLYFLNTQSKNYKKLRHNCICFPGDSMYLI